MMRKVLSVLLALTLLCSLVMPALAEDIIGGDNADNTQTAETPVVTDTENDSPDEEEPAVEDETPAETADTEKEEEVLKPLGEASETQGDNVCKYDSKFYPTVQVAVDVIAAKGTDKSGTIELVKETTATTTGEINIGADVSVTLDLAGYVLTLGTTPITVQEGGTLTIKDTPTNPVSSHKYVTTNALWVLNDPSGTTSLEGGVITGATKGAIVNEGTLTINGGNFAANNYNDTTTPANGIGGVIRSYGTLKIAGGRFLYNTASGNGGAVAVIKGTAEIAGGSFESNSAANGGAIYASTAAGASAATTVKISGASFVNNSAANGGAIYATTLGSSTKATDLNITAADAVTFTGNKATNGNGGAIYVYTETGATATTLTTNAKVSFTENTATKDGGAIATGDANLNLTGSTFTGNTATGNGGAVAIDNAKTTNAALNTLSVTECTAQNGGGIAITGGTVTVTGGTVTKCSAKSCGGGIYLYDENVKNSTSTSTLTPKTAVTLSGCTIGGTSTTVGNYAVTSGGGVYNYGVLNMTGALVITNNYLSSSAAYTTTTELDPTKLLEQKKTASDNLNNLYCETNVAAAVSNAATDMSVGVSTATAPVKGSKVIAFATGVATDAGFFSSDATGQYVSSAISGSTVYLALFAKYSVSMNTTVTAGTMNLSTAAAAPGEKVYVTLTSTATYKITNVSVLKTDSTAVTLSQDNSGVYFVMPEGDVVIAVDTTKTTASADKIVAAQTADTWRIIFYVTLLSASVGGVGYMMYRRLRPYRDL